MTEPTLDDNIPARLSEGERMDYTTTQDWSVHVDSEVTYFEDEDAARNFASEAILFHDAQRVEITFEGLPA